MKFSIKYSLLSLASSFILFSCSSQDDMMKDLDNQPQSCELIMNVEKTGFDEMTTRSATDWENGDTVYLIFDTENGSTYGDAVYNNGKWNLTFFGSLVTSKSTQCQAVYIENQVEEMGSVITTDQNSAIYETVNAQYLYDGTTLVVTATLSPKTGRIRFEGENGKQFKLYGISYYSAFDTSTGKFTLTKGMLQCSVNGTSTPYFYGVFTDPEEPRVNIIYTASAFTKQFPTNIYQPGESGFVTLPTNDVHSGWRNRAIFNINGVELTMIPVEYEEGNFLLAETETTEALYNAALGEGESSLLPKTGISNWNNFCTTLFTLTNLNFRLPNLKEWQFAFEGGKESKGYTYSGSDNIYEVAWFNGNSDNKKHPVKQLQPNELGFYDMSGNVCEALSDRSSYYGGFYSVAASECKVNSYSYSNTQAGCRLALSN